MGKNFQGQSGLVTEGRAPKAGETLIQDKK